MLRQVNAALAAKDQGGNAVALTPASEMVMKTSYSEASQLARLKGLAERGGKKEAPGSLSGGWIKVAEDEREMEALEELSRRKDLSKTAVIRQALRLYQMVDARLAAGEKLFFEDERAAKKAEVMVL